MPSSIFLQDGAIIPVFFHEIGPLDGAIIHCSSRWVRWMVPSYAFFHKLGPREHFFLKDIYIKNIIKRNKEIIYIYILKINVK
jgi:hypothetical protein